MSRETVANWPVPPASTGGLQIGVDRGIHGTDYGVVSMRCHGCKTMLTAWSEKALLKKARDRGWSFYLGAPLCRPCEDKAWEEHVQTTKAISEI